MRRLPFAIAILFAIVGSAMAGCVPINSAQPDVISTATVVASPPPIITSAPAEQAAPPTDPAAAPSGEAPQPDTEAAAPSPADDPVAIGAGLAGLAAGACTDWAASLTQPDDVWPVTQEGAASKAALAAGQDTAWQELASAMQELVSLTRQQSTDYDRGRALTDTVSANCGKAGVQVTGG